MYICVINIVKKKKAVYHLPHSVYDGSCTMCILNHHAAHIYLCGDMTRTVYGQNIWNLRGQIYVPLSGTMEKYTNNIQNLCRQRYVPLSRTMGKIFGIYVDTRLLLQHQTLIFYINQMYSRIYNIYILHYTHSFYFFYF